MNRIAESPDVAQGAALGRDCSHSRAESIGRFTRWAAAMVSTALLAACGGTSSPYLRLQAEPHGAFTRLTLLPAPGARINARLAPALELRDGSVLRFEGVDVTPDSSYFTAPPRLDVRGDPAGLVRASVCPEGESLCRRVELRSPG